jgi:mannose-6-phosphate isomerase-like protein (cupin superfamily)
MHPKGRDFVRAKLAIAVLCLPVISVAQIRPSRGWGCTVTTAGGMTCNGPSTIPTNPNDKVGEAHEPKLLITQMRLEAGAAFDVRDALSDFVIEGISEGALVNEKTPFRYVDLGKGSVTLMPSGKQFRLRNKSAATVEFRVIEIQH